MKKQNIEHEEATEQDKKDMIDSLMTFEPFGMYYLNCLKNDTKPRLLSTMIASPYPVQVVELGENVRPEDCSKYAWDMLKKITYQMQKVQILKEAYIYRNKHFLVRIKRPGSAMPVNCAKIDLPLWNGYEEAEVIFFARSPQGEGRIQRWVNKYMGDVKHNVNLLFSVFCNDFGKKLMKDPDVNFICKLAYFMTKGLREPKHQSRAHLRITK